MTFSDKTLPLKWSLALTLEARPGFVHEYFDGVTTIVIGDSFSAAMNKFFWEVLCAKGQFVFRGIQDRAVHIRYIGKLAKGVRNSWWRR